MNKKMAVIAACHKTVYQGAADASKKAYLEKYGK